MNIITVIPLARGIPKENLDYFTIKNIPVGTVVSIPLRKKIIEGIVVNTEDISQRKGSIKTSDFKLKRLEGPSSVEYNPEGEAVLTSRSFVSENSPHCL